MLADEISASAAAIAGSDDLLPEILLRLPLKPLTRAKSVSKHWLSVISSPYFSFRLNPVLKPPSGIFLHRSHTLSLGIEHTCIPKPSYLPFHHHHHHHDTDLIDPLAFFNQKTKVFILQSCNGLLSCYDSVNRNYFVLNPTTWQTRNLDIPGLEFHHLRCFGVNIAFDPLKSPHYKVICVRDSVFSTQSVPYCQIEIYSSETCSWRPSGESFTAPVGVDFSMILFSGGVFWNGAMNWITVNGGDSLYFNLEQERIHTLPMPRPICGRVWYFGESSNHLHHVACDESRIVMEFRIFEMERDYSGWFVKYSVTFGDVRDVCLEMGLDRESFFSILCILRRENGSEDESVLVFQLKGNRTVVWYNLMGKPFNKVLDLAPTTSSADANINESSCTNSVLGKPLYTSMMSRKFSAYGRIPRSKGVRSLGGTLILCLVATIY